MFGKDYKKNHFQHFYVYNKTKNVLLKNTKYLKSLYKEESLPNEFPSGTSKVSIYVQQCIYMNLCGDVFWRYFKFRESILESGTCPVLLM